MDDTKREGFWCEKHDEYSAEAVCRWCEPAPEADIVREYEKQMGLPPANSLYVKPESILDVAKRLEAERPWPPILPRIEVLSQKNPHLQDAQWKEPAPRGRMICGSAHSTHELACYDPAHFIPCKCGEYVFDKIVTDHGFEGVGEEKLHTPERCTAMPAPRIPDKPRTATEQRALEAAGEVLTSDERDLLNAYRQALAAGHIELRWHIPLGWCTWRRRP